MYHPEKLTTYGTQKKKTTRTHMCWTQLYAHKHKYGKYALLLTTGGKDERNIMCMLKS
jgi:hypothetical protein